MAGVPLLWNRVSAAKDALWQLPVCNIEILEEDAWRLRFLEEFHGQSPVILRGWSSEATQKLAERMENETMLSEFGKVEVRVGRGFFFHVQGQAEESLPLEDFVRSMPNDNYLFDFGEFMEQSGLSANWSLPPVLEQLGTYDTSSVPLRLALGSTGQGMPFHSHEDSYHLQLQGRKRWGIYAPGKMTRTGVLHSEDYTAWLRFRRRGRGFVPPQWECVSEPGDLLYVPEGFQHATASLGYSVAVVQQARRALPWSAVFHRHAAVQASREKQRKQAVKLAKKAAKLDPTNSDLWLTLAQIHQGPDSDSAAQMVKYCEKGLKANPLCGKTRLHLLMAYNSLGLASKTQELMEETKSLGRELVETVDFLVQAEQKRRTEL
ncbi:Jmjd8 [Symbiodinium sp. CCMP2456]|nr:Jmjd8 [Symbiodinium sp. CCMP2456]